MDSGSRTLNRDEDREKHRGGILQRIEEKLDRLLHPGDDDDWDLRKLVPPGPTYTYSGPGDPEPRLFGGPRVDAAGWDPSIAGPRFDHIDVGSVGTHGVLPVSSFDGAQEVMFGPHSSAREYYLMMRARGQGNAGDAGGAGDGASGYSDYRRRKEAELDREYADYCRDRQACFDRDFNEWRQKRTGPPPSADEPARQDPAGKQKAQES